MAVFYICKDIERNNPCSTRFTFAFSLDSHTDFAYVFFVEFPNETTVLLEDSLLGAGGRGAETTVLLEDSLLGGWRTGHGDHRST